MNTSETLDEKKSTPARRAENGRVLAVENEHAVLAGLAKYGYLSAAQLQALVWPASTQPRLAQRTLKRLVEANKALPQYTPQGRRVYALTAAGACCLRAIGFEGVEPTTNALKRTFHVTVHRSLSNDLCVWWQTFPGRTADEVFTEYEIERGKAPIVKKEAHLGKLKGKIPDALLLLPPVEHAAKGTIIPVAWGEVEMSDKRGKDYKHLITELCHMLGGYGKERYALPDERYEIHHALVACPNEKHEEKLAKGVLSLLAISGWRRYNWSYVKNGVHIWRPNGACFSLVEWMKLHPEVEAWDATLRSIWRDKNFDRT